jgi:hypothetical protein
MSMNSAKSWLRLPQQGHSLVPSWNTGAEEWKRHDSASLLSSL